MYGEGQNKNSIIPLLNELKDNQFIFYCSTNKEMKVNNVILKACAIPPTPWGFIL